VHKRKRKKPHARGAEKKIQEKSHDDNFDKYTIQKCRNRRDKKCDPPGRKKDAEEKYDISDNTGGYLGHVLEVREMKLEIWNRVVCALFPPPSFPT
jgi:hypothetical protein